MVSRCAHHVITTPSGVAVTLSSARRQVLSDVVGSDRQLAVAAVDEDGELDRRGRP